MGSQSSGLPASKEYGEMLVSASMSEYRLIYCSDRVTLRKVTQLHTDRWDGQDNCSKYECESVTSSVMIHYNLQITLMIYLHNLNSY